MECQCAAELAKFHRFSARAKERKQTRRSIKKAAESAKQPNCVRVAMPRSD